MDDVKTWDLNAAQNHAAGLSQIGNVLGLEPSYDWADVETTPRPTIDFNIPPAGAGPLKQTMQALGGGLYGTAADISGAAYKMLGLDAYFGKPTSGALLDPAIDYWSQKVESPYHYLGEESRGWKIAKDIAALAQVGVLAADTWAAIKLQDARVTYDMFERKFDKNFAEAFPKIRSGLTNAKQTAVLDDLKAILFNRHLQQEAASYPRTTLYGGLPVKWQGGLTETSGIEKALKTVSQTNWQVPQLIGFLKGKVSQDEIQHLLMPVVEGKDTVTTSDILTQIPIRIPQVEEVVKSAKPIWTEEFIKMHQKEFSELEGRQLSRQETIDQMNRQASDGWADTEDITKAQSQPKFAVYQVPGGENYREVLIRAPETSRLISHEYDAKPLDGKWAIYEKGVEFPLASGYDTKQLAEHYINTAFAKETRETPGFKSSHWDEPNVLAHLRMNDHTTPDGKKVLFIEEIQSDWNKAYRTELASAKESNLPNPEGYAEAKVTSHPLLKNWQELAVKRALREAVDGGYDYIAWTSGQQQIKRYPGLKAGEDIEKVRRGETWAHNLYEKQMPNILKSLTKGDLSTVKIKGNDMSPSEAKAALGQGRKLYWHHHEGFDGYAPIDSVSDLNEAIDEGIPIFEQKFKVKKTITIPADRTSKEKGKPAWFVTDEAGKLVDLKYSQDEAYDKAHELNASSGELTQPALKITSEIRTRFNDRTSP